jgi:2-haloalkanoic acid dehalogenase type II
MQRFDVVFLDFFGTVAAGDQEAVARTCVEAVKRLELPLEPAELAVRWGEAFFHIMEETNRADFLTLQECSERSLDFLLADLEIEADLTPFIGRMQEYMVAPPIHEDARNFLEAKPLPVCCVSNADTEVLHQAIAHHGLNFDEVVTSEDARSYKPDGRIFEMALDKMQVDPSRVLHVGDSLFSDIMGGRRAGLTTAWIRREQRIHDIGEAEPDHTIASLMDILPLLDGVEAAR